jgi:hypothetical protein
MFGKIQKGQAAGMKFPINNLNFINEANDKTSATSAF